MNNQTQTMKNKIFSLVFLLSLNLHSQQTLTWNLKSLYGISQEGFIAINKDIKDHFVQYPDDSIIIEIDEGTYAIGGNNSYGIHISNITQSGGSGRLIYQGEGKNRTNLVFTDIAQHMLRGVNVYRTEFRDMHMTRPNYTITQGHVVSVSKGKIILAIQEGFPSPLDIWKDWDQGRYLKKYTDSPSNPILIETENEQVPFGYRNGKFRKPVLVDSEKNWWQFFLNKASLELTNYPIGTLVGVKSKHAGDAYWFNGGDDILFKNIKWTHSSRGLVRGGINNVRVIGCSIERAEPINGQVQCLSTSDGGIQMNQYESTGNVVSTGMIVKDFFCDSPGDDCVAFFNVDGGQVINTKLNNSFGRGIFLAEEAQNICVLDSEMNDCPFQDGEVDKGSKIIYETHSLQEAIDNGYLKDDCAATAKVIESPQGDSANKRLLVSTLVSDELLFFEQQKDVKVINTLGVILASGKNISTLDVAALAKGVYVVYSAKNMERFIKQ